MPNTSPFAELVRRIRAGDEHAAEELVRSYETPIRVLVRSRLTDPAMNRHFDSADVCQSVLASFFVRMAAGQYDLDSPGQLVGLLVRMAQNKLTERVRFHKQECRDAHRQGDLGEAAYAVPQGGPGPDRVAAGRELLELVLERLGPQERAIAELRGRGKGWAEIGAALGGTADGLRVQLKRALDRLAPELGLDAEGDDD
jgi:RNA polymerase sigma-70 factor (ECF subfamily)